jgi:ATP-dependent Clp protease adapter protein ClpS/Zn-dependent protease
MSHDSGSLKITLRGVPFYIHWSLPAAGLFLWPVTGASPVEMLYYCLAFACLIVIHELGHAAAAGHLGLKVHAVLVSGSGGMCQCNPPQTQRGAVLLYSAGLLAQVALLLSTLLTVAWLGYPASVFGKCVVSTFVAVNLLVMVLNLVPFRLKDGLATDGLVLWQLLVHAVRRAANHGRVFAPQTRLLSMAGFQPPGFTTGIEILNDRTTSMHLVVALLQKYLDLEPDDAARLMLEIHHKGGVLIPIEGMERAVAVAAALAREAAEEGHLLVCRAAQVTTGSR